MRHLRALSTIAILGCSLLLPPAHAQRLQELGADRTDKRGAAPLGYLENGDFSSGRPHPWIVHQPSMLATLDVVDGQGVVTLAEAGAEPWTQLYQKGLYLQADTLYKLKFDASSSEGSNLRARIIMHGEPFENYGLVENVNVQKRMRTFELWFRSPAWDVYDARVSFLLTPYGLPGEVYTFDNVWLEPAQECGDGIVAGDETCDSGAGPIIEDGGFEAGSPNPVWDEFSSGFGTPLCSLATCGLDLAFEGDWYAWFGGTALEEDGSLTQSVTLPAAAALDLYFRLWPASCSGETTDLFEVLVDGVPVFGFDLSDPFYCSLQPYTPVGVDLTPWAGWTVDLQFHAVTGTTGVVSNVFVDAVSIDVDGCRADCSYCGDGIVNDGEECEPTADNGNKGGLVCTDECRFALPDETEAVVGFGSTDLFRP